MRPVDAQRDDRTRRAGSLARSGNRKQQPLRTGKRVKLRVPVTPPEIWSAVGLGAFLLGMAGPVSSGRGIRGASHTGQCRWRSGKLRPDERRSEGGRWVTLRECVGRRRGSVVDARRVGGSPFPGRCVTDDDDDNDADGGHTV